MNTIAWTRRITSFRLGRTAVIGILASAANLLTLMLLVKDAQWDPKVAIVPALISGSLIQFIGNRYFVFQASSGHMGKQLFRFGLTEVSGMLLNTLVYRGLIRWTPINYVLAQPLGTFLVFICFSYPLWGLIFKPKSSSAQSSPAT